MHLIYCATSLRLCSGEVILSLPALPQPHLSQRAVDLLNDEWELDPPATPAILQPWIEDEEAVPLAKLRVEADRRKENAIQKFRAHREAGLHLQNSVNLTPWKGY